MTPPKVSACDFGYNGTSTDKAAAQAALKPHLTPGWPMCLPHLTGVAGGCAPIATPTWDGTYPDICGDAITMTWNVIDICETTKFDATYTVTAPDCTYRAGRDTNKG